MTDHELAINEMTETDESRRRLVYIPIERLFPHPDNPRKDLGDLAELTDSIIANGVMQNLTVVPSINSTDEYTAMLDGTVKCSAAYREHSVNHAFQGDYTIIIGHRRHAAAVLAGTKELPCVVTDMDYPTQIATMMTENLQRVDLTIYEQAQGFKQLSMDFGMSIERIAEKTGFSASTVRRRLKLCELNQDTLKEVSGRQISMADFERLYKIEDPKLRDEALKEIGTANFNSKCYAAEQQEALKKKIDAWRKLCLDAGMIEITEKEGQNDKYKWVYNFCTAEPTHSAIEPYLNGQQLYFYVNRWGYTYLKTIKTEDAPKSPEQIEREKKEQEREDACAALKEAFERAYKLRYDFIDSFNETRAEKVLPEIMRMAARANLEFCNGADEETFWSLMGGSEERWSEIEDDEHEIFESVKDGVTRIPHCAALAMAYATFNDAPTAKTYNYWGQYSENERLAALYEHLCELGYEMSDEERELLHGTSELYYRDEGEGPSIAPDEADEEHEPSDPPSEPSEPASKGMTRFEYIKQLSDEERKARYDIDPHEMEDVETPEDLASNILWICPSGGSRACEHSDDKTDCLACIVAWLLETSENGFDEHMYENEEDTSND